MILEAEVRCDVGKVRLNNEDMVLLGDQLIRDASASKHYSIGHIPERLVLAVADGMGGAQAGEVASETALARLRELPRHLPDDLTGDELQEVFTVWAAETHRILLAMGDARPECKGMGTTVVALFCYHDAAYRFHAGDSRLYRLRNGELQRLTRDHSARERDPSAHHASNLLVNSLGAGEQSWLEFAPLEGGLQPNDRFLLSSDGLHDLVDDTVIGRLLAGERAAAADTLVRIAYAQGGKDNISILIADLTQDPELS